MNCRLFVIKRSHNGIRCSLFAHNKIICHDRQAYGLWWNVDGRRQRSTTTSTQYATEAAMELLGLSSSSMTNVLTMKELRGAYFRASKECHPDSQLGRNDDDDDATTNNNNNNRMSSADATAQFLAITDAYETLQAHLKQQRPSSSSTTHPNGIDIDYITKSEEEQFREACQEWLGIPAEIVEESKKCPIFREWLKGKTDAALHWTIFFMCNGGLAPKLRPPEALIADGLKVKLKPRRKKTT